MSPLTGRHEELEKLLGDLAGEAGLDELQDRALDAAHLEEDHYEALVSAGTLADEDEELRNLKRHVLFCDLCAREFLARAAPAAEAAFAEADAEREHTRWSRRLVLVGLIGALAVAVAVWRPWASDDGTLGPPRGFPVIADRSGLGRVFGRAGAAADRLFVHVKTSGLSEPPHLYVFLVAGQRIRVLHPSGGADPRSPLPATGVVPAAGWADPGGDRPRRMLVLVTDGPVPLLASPDGIAARVLELQIRLVEESAEAAWRTLAEMRVGPGRAFLLTVEE